MAHRIPGGNTMSYRERGLLPRLQRQNYVDGVKQNNVKFKTLEKYK